MPKNKPHYLIGLLLSALLVLTGGACGRKGFVVEGELDAGADRTLYIEELTPRNGVRFVDSVRLDHRGHFSFRHTAPYATFYNLHTSETDYVVLQPNNGEKLHLVGNFDDLCRSYEIEGSPESVLLWQLQDYSNLGVEALERLREENRQNQQSLSESEYLEAKRRTDSVYIELYKQQREYVAHFIQQHEGSLTTLIALYKPFNINHPLINPETDFSLFELVLEGLERELPDNPHTINFRNTVEQLRYRYGKQAASWTLDGADNETEYEE